MFTRLMIVLTLPLTLTSLANAQDHTLVKWQTHKLDGEFFSEGATAGDFNHDGTMDIASGPFWYAGPEYKERHQFYAQDAFDPHGYSNNFFAYTQDVNGDGWEDILIYGFPGKDASWFENPKGAKRFWPRHQVLDVVDNESPTFIDITGDGQREIVCSSGGYFGFAEVNRTSPEMPWKFRRISDQSAGGRFTHGLGVGDVNGDGKLDLLEKNGWWEQPKSLEGDPVWKKHEVVFSAGHGSAQMFAYDVDGDDDNDVICSLNAHGYGLAWFEQQRVDGAIKFEKHLIMGAKPSENSHGVVFSQLHAVELVDINGDGLKDIVTGKRHWAHGPRGDSMPNAPAVIYWFELQRNNVAAGRKPSGNAIPDGSRRTATIDWIPHLIDDDSGVGVEVKYADLNADGAPDIFVGNKKGTYVHLQQRSKVTAAESRRATPRSRDMIARASGKGLPDNAGLTPEKAAEAMTLPNGFTVHLAAGEPMVHQPIAMAFDHRGRLWIAEAHTYPIRAPEGKGEDKILILEDTDHDGSFDKRTVFIEGLNLVSGMQVGFGGVWVGAAPYLMFIPDRDGDDKPDADPQILLDGFGYQDTHETLNAFIWGPDGWLYGCHGVFTHSKVGKPGTPDEERLPLNAGMWRYHPTRHTFEMFARGTSNPWGVDFNDYGQAFITACVIPHMYHIIHGARYQRQGGQHFNPYIYDDIKTIADHAHYAGNIRDHAWWGRNESVDHADTNAAGGGHAHAGAMIYLGDNWPTQYRNSIFMTNLLGNRINNDILRRNGSGYVASHGNDLLFANDLWSRIINQNYGPDGSVYMIDWYDKNACHRANKELWDRTNGRVFRVSFGNCKPQAVDLSKLTDAELIQLQLHENDWYVRMARRLLQQRVSENKADVDLLKRKLHAIVLGTPSKQVAEGRKPSGDAATAANAPLTAQNRTARAVPLLRQRLRAVWTLHACGLLGGDVIEKLLADQSHKAEYLRAWAIQLDLEDGQPTNLATLEQLASSDDSALVRLYLASALQQLPLDDRWKIASGLVRHADDAADHNLPLMIWYGVEPLVTHDTKQAFALAGSSRIPLVRQFIYRRAAADRTAINELLATLADVQDLPTQKLILGEITAAIAKQGRLKMPAGWPGVYAKLSASDDEQLREQAQLVTVKFGDASIFPTLRKIVADSKAKLSSRTSALKALLVGKDEELAPLLIELIDDKAMRSTTLRGLANYADDKTPPAIIKSYGILSAEERTDAIATLASRATFAHALLDAVDKKTIPRKDLSAYTVRQISLLNDKALAAKINRVWGSLRSTSAEKQKRIATLKSNLNPKALADADLSHGRHLYKETCGKCHRLFGTGGDIGPDITGSNRVNLDYILQNMVDPNALIGKDYQATQVALADGRVLNGLLKEENATAIVLQTANEKLVIDKDDIEQRQLSKTSMMPEGQLDKMKPDQIRDLVAYLASSRQVPLPGEGPYFDEKAGRVAGALEGESLRIVSKSAGNAGSQGMGNFKADRWSRSSHLWWTGAKPGTKLVLEVPAKESGVYEVFVVMTKAVDYGIVKLAINDVDVKGTFDLYDKQVITTGIQSLGTHELRSGANKLTVTITGANPLAVKAYMFGLDYVYLAKQNRTSKSE